MAVITKKDKQLFYKYSLKELYILIGSESIKLDVERLNSFTIVDDFIESTYPEIKCDLALEESLYFKILRKKQDVKIKIYFQTFYREGTKKKKSVKKKTFSEVFYLILDDATDDLGEKIRKEEYPSKKGDKDQMNAVTTTSEFFLYKRDMILKNTNVVGGIFHNCTVTTAITYVMTKSGINNVLMSRSDNPTAYPFLFLPQMSAIEALQYLDTFYGIHRSGTMMYFGMSRTYVIPYCKPSGAVGKDEKEVVTVVIPDKGSHMVDNSCQIKKKGDENKVYIVAEPDSFDVQNIDVTESVLKPEDVTIVDVADGSIEKTKIKNRSTIVKKTVNPFFIDTFNSKIEGNRCVVSLFFKDIDVNLITPNKTFQMVFEDTKLSKKYKGKFFLCSSEVNFLKEGKEFSVGINAVFRKM